MPQEKPLHLQDAGPLLCMELFADIFCKDGQMLLFLVRRKGFYSFSQNVYSVIEDP